MTANLTNIQGVPDNNNEADFFAKQAAANEYRKKVTTLSRDELLEYLNLTDPSELQKLYDRAYQVKLAHVGNKVYYRGLVEFSNICAKDCSYCGIRKSIPADRLERYRMTKDEIMEMVRWVDANRYGSVTLQSGEVRSPDFTEFVADIIRTIAAETALGITLCLGEQSDETYRYWFDCGAHRYLLRIETGSPALYANLHPPGDAEKGLEARIACLKSIKRIGYQTGTGTMIDLPGQTNEHLADDLLFFKEHNIDMLGMGPYVVHKHTPLAETAVDTEEERAARVQSALKMIALARLTMPDINIAATTALHALDPLGREKGLKAGANILMPITTPLRHRRKYQLYSDKPHLDDDAEFLKESLTARVRSVGDEVAFGQRGDSLHFGR